MNRVEEYIPQESIPSAATPPPPKTKKRYLDWLLPSECISFEPPKDFILAGDCHLTRGGVTILAGAPGVGKSRCAMGLTISGASGCDWMGYEVKSRWKTLIIQAENGPFRLKGEFTDIQESCSVNLDEFARITPPPIYGMAFDNLEFIAELREKIADFKPGLIIIDPWNRAC